MKIKFLMPTSKVMFCPKCCKNTVFYWNSFRWVCMEHEKGHCGK